MIPLKDDNPVSRFPFVTVSIIAINAVVFIYQLSLVNGEGDAFVYRTAAIPYEITHLVDVFPFDVVPVPFTLFTSMFLHAGFLHIGGNMLFLWIFGDNIEDAFGHVGFVFFYLSSGAVAGLTHILTVPDSLTPMLGASGAVAGVLGAYLVLFPRAQVHTLVFLFFFIRIIKLPAMVFLGLWFLFQIVGLSGGGNIAWYAHIGGFLTGALTALIVKAWPRRSWGR